MTHTLLGWLIACTMHTTNDSGTEQDSEVSEPSGNSTATTQDATQAFRVPERPWDLELSPEGLIYCSTQGGDKVYVFEPEVNERTEFQTSLSDVQNLYFSPDGVLYFTHTDHGVTGGFSMVNGSRTEVLYTQADDGTLFRWPMSIVATPNSTVDNPSWVIADFGAGALFFIHSDGSVTVHESGSTKPQSQLFVDEILYIAGEDGIFKQSWPSGSIQQVDERVGLSLEVIDGRILSSNADAGIFEVGNGALGLNQAARPGSLLYTEYGLFFADHVGEGVWLTSFEE